MRELSQETRGADTMGYENMLLIVVLIGTVLFGAKKIPDLARSVGRAQVEYEKARIQARKEISSLVEDKGGEVQVSAGQDPMKDDEQPVVKVESGGSSKEEDAAANGNVVVYDNATTTRLRDAARKIGVSNAENLTDEELRKAIRRHLLP